MKSPIYLLMPFLLIVTGLNACKKLIEIPSPKNQLTTDKVFADSISATAALVNIYALFDKNINPSYNAIMDCYTDELQYSGTTQESIQYNQGAVSPANSLNMSYWQNSYAAIYACNDLLEQTPISAGLSQKIKKQFQAEAKFLRAYTYLSLVNTYGAVPMVLTTDVNLNARAARADSATVYKQIVQDLLDARSGLSADYEGQGKVRANQYAAAALLARVYLWQKNWSAAAAAADAVISSGLYTPLPGTSIAFLANSTETILAFYTQFGYVFDATNLIPSSGPPQYYYSKSQLDAFEPGDQRKADWVLQTITGPSALYSPYKYRNIAPNTSSPEFLIALRAGEQFLIRAEASAQLANLPGAVNDLNVVRNRAGLAAYNGLNDKAAVLKAIYHERQVELFSEWGNRFADLKRTETLNTVNSALKPAWKSTSVVLPVPQSEINSDPNLKQNQGY